MMTSAEVAQVLRVSYRTVMKEIGAGTIPAKKFGPGYRIRKDWLLNHIGAD